MIYDASRPFDNCNNIDQVIEIINNDFSCDLTKEKLVAIYVCDAIEKSDYKIYDEITIEFHMDILIQNGAIFNYRKAIDIIEE